MDQKDLRDWEKRCIQEEPPLCRAGCPLSVDARAFSLAMAAGKTDSARAILEKSMPLAAIVARLCEAPCEQYCLRKDFGGAVAIGALERQCITSTASTMKIMPLPARPKRVSVIGSGPSSLTAAFELARKGYPVAIHHQEAGVGSWLRDLPNEALPQDILTRELAILQKISVTFHPAAALDAALLSSIKADAVYIGHDDQLDSDLTADYAACDSETFVTKAAHIFSGGNSEAQSKYRFITDVSQGREAATSIDRFLQGASLTASRVFPRNGHTELFTETQNVRSEPRLTAADPAGFTAEEAAKEAGRCLDCQCLECVKHCVYLADSGGYPKTYARRIYNNSAIVKGVHMANRFINSCSLCRQCEHLCPNDFSMADLCLEARQLMVNENRMPPSAHWFALEEMRSVHSGCACIHHAQETTRSTRLFFPGCQLAGIRPEQTLWLYDQLRADVPETGIWLDCCTAPAHWAARQDEQQQMLSRLDTLWQEAGRPLVILACSSCLQMFRQFLPQIPVQSVWAVLQTPATATPLATPLALSDPCTSRDDLETQQAVRKLAATLGQPLADLPLSGELTECCGFGGLMENANPEVARKVIDKRVSQSDVPFLTYCAMCRDQLAKTGKKVYHLLDLLKPDLAHAPDETAVSISERRANRRTLKSRLSLGGQAEESWQRIAVQASPDVQSLLDKRRILLDDIQRVLDLAITRQSFLQHAHDGRMIASATLGEVTFWVEYRKTDDVYQLLSAWCHRMHIAGGQS